MQSYLNYRKEAEGKDSVVHSGHSVPFEIMQGTEDICVGLTDTT